MSSDNEINIEFEGKLWERKALIYYLYTNKDSDELVNKHGKLTYECIGKLVVNAGEKPKTKQYVKQIIDEYTGKSKKKETQVVYNKNSGEIKVKILSLASEKLPTASEYCNLLQINIYEALSGLSQIRATLRSEAADIKTQTSFELSVLKFLAPYSNLLAKQQNSSSG